MKTKKIKQLGLYLISIFLITFIIISCSKDPKQETKNNNEKTDTGKKTTTADTNKKITNTTNSRKGAAGKEIFYMKSKENNISCADCHSDGTNRNNLLTKFFSIVEGANMRTSTYHGKFTGEEVKKNAGGATVCWETYMKMKTPLTDQQINDLNDYYASIASEVSPTEVTYETIALPTRDKSKLKDVQNTIMNLKGNPAAGEQIFQKSCVVCHGENSTIKKVPSILKDFDGNIKSIVYNVRLGNGSMPFFKTHVLSDQDVADISAYIMQKNGK